MAFFDVIIGLMAPHRCLGCGREGKLLCASCQPGLRAALPCCYRCGQPDDRARTCEACRRQSSLQQVRAATVYRGLAKDMVWKFKFGHAQAAAREMAVLMQPLYAAEPRGSLLIVPVPTATTRVRQRGFDQARLLARALARQLGQPYAAVLSRQGQAHQVGSGRQQRLRQLAGVFRVRRMKLVGHAQAILLVDDVVTTGATLEEAAHCLQAAGAKQIRAAVFAQQPAPQINRDPSIRQ